MEVRLVGRHRPSFFEIIQPTLDGFQRGQFFERLLDLLIGFFAEEHPLRLAINSENLGPPRAIGARKMTLGVPLEIRERMDVFDGDHGRIEARNFMLAQIFSRRL